MNLQRGAGALSMAIALALAPAATEAQSPASHAPIAVTAVIAHPPRTQESGSSIQSGTVEIVFHNTRKVVVKRIVFDLYAGNKHVASATAHGTFSPGVTIRKTFPDTAAASHQQAVVATVTFGDGSVWVKKNDRTKN